MPDCSKNNSSSYSVDQKKYEENWERIFGKNKNMKIKTFVKKFRPILNLWIQLPYFEVRTALLNECMDSDSIEYVMLHVKIYKWQFSLRLYNTMTRVESNR